MHCRYCGSSAKMSTLRAWKETQEIDTSLLDEFGQLIEEGSWGTETLEYALLRCQECKEVSLTRSFWSDFLTPYEQELHPATVYPQDPFDLKGLPKQVQIECRKASRLRAKPDAYLVGLRRVLEAVCQDLLGKERRVNLARSLAEVVSQEGYPSPIERAIQEVRRIANPGAHVGENSPTRSDRERAESLVSFCLRCMYELPVLLKTSP